MLATMKHNMEIQKIIGTAAGIAAVLGTVFTIYSHVTGKEPDQQMTNLIIEERQRHKELIDVLEKIASQEVVEVKSEVRTQSILPTNSNQRSLSQRSPTESDKVERNEPNCTIDNANRRIIVPALNVRSGPAKLSSLAAWLGAVKHGDLIRSIDSKSSGPFGLGTDWIKIEYCNKDKKTGWISTEIVGGSPTTEEI